VRVDLRTEADDAEGAGAYHRALGPLDGAGDGSVRPALPRTRRRHRKFAIASTARGIGTRRRCIDAVGVTNDEIRLSTLKASTRRPIIDRRKRIRHPLRRRVNQGKGSNMGLRVNTNIASINAQRNVAGVTTRLQKNFQKLSTGLRISGAADDAAGLAISERLRAQVRSLAQASRNANDGISLVQVGEGALNEVSNILVRLREISVQAANGSSSTADKDTLNEEFQSLINEINRIGLSTEFNGIKLLDGSSSSVSFQVGINTTANVDVLNITLTAALSTTLGLSALNIGSVGSTSTAITSIDTAINQVSALRGRFGALQNRLQSTIANLGVAYESLSAAESRIRDVDVAFETAELTRNSILQQAAISILGQANAQPQAALALLQG
jgi:flagellin